jgi:hypothetical protein
VVAAEVLLAHTHTGERKIAREHMQSTRTYLVTAVVSATTSLVHTLQ